jgi:acetyl-CoA C-acetyltransferase/acetyl-CoA acyltransferase
VVDGTVTLAGEQAANPARLAVLLSGFPVKIPGCPRTACAARVSRRCISPRRRSRPADMNYVVASGVESMTRVPMFLDISLGREGVSGFDTLNPEMFERHALIHQGESAERVAEQWGLTRRMLDDSPRTATAKRIARKPRI